MKINKAHCFFEQSGTFRDAFQKLGIPAIDYDIQNEYKRTDIIIDIFTEIKKAKLGLDSIFDDIKSDEIIVAFFPCIRFTKQIELQFTQKAPRYKNYSAIEKIEYAKKLEKERFELYNLFADFCSIVYQLNLRAIIENPYSTNHYLTRYFPIPATIIDYNRRERGDWFEKPTQYWFINCEPTYNSDALFREQVIQKETRRVNDYAFKSKERSEISPQYALQFIEEFIL